MHAISRLSSASGKHAARGRPGRWSANGAALVTPHAAHWPATARHMPSRMARPHARLQRWWGTGARIGCCARRLRGDKARVHAARDWDARLAEARPRVGADDGSARCSAGMGHGDNAIAARRRRCETSQAARRADARPGASDGTTQR